MGRIFVVDSGGTSRLVRRMFVVDSGGTSRLIKRAFAVDSGGTARQIYSSETVSLSASYSFGGENLGWGLNYNDGFSFTVLGTLFTISSIEGVNFDVPIGNWVSDPPPEGSYEVMATVNSGSVAPGSSATGSWLALNVRRFWRPNPTLNLTVQIRDATNGTVLATTTVST